jgi:hypothetical protein
MADTIFERYGGFAQVSRVVSAFYGKVLASPVISGYFDHADMRTLVDHAEYMLDSYSQWPRRTPASCSARRSGSRSCCSTSCRAASIEEMKDFGTTTPQRFDAPRS